MSVTWTFMLTLVFLIGMVGLVWLICKFLRDRNISVKGAAAAVVCVMAVGVSVWYFAPRTLDGYEAQIMQQSVRWSGVEQADTQPACAQLKQLPDGLALRRYRLGDTPMPGSGVGTRAVQIELTFADGKTAVLMLCPERPASSRIWLYDAPYGLSIWFLTKQSAMRCLAAFLPEGA